MTPAGKDVILEIFATGDPFGAVAAYEGRPFPASAIALEDTVCLLTRGGVFLTARTASVARARAAARVDAAAGRADEPADRNDGRPRRGAFARLFLKLADNIGRPPGRHHHPMPLSRQELADLTGTTIETCIRIMSRWGKDEIVRTEKDSFVLLDRPTLEELAAS